MGIRGGIIWSCISGLCWPLRTFTVIKFKINIVCFVTISILIGGRIPVMLELLVCSMTFVIYRVVLVAECAFSRGIFELSTIRRWVIVSTSETSRRVCVVFFWVAIGLEIMAMHIILSFVGSFHFDFDMKSRC